MEYVGLFLWLSLCLSLAAAVHHILGSALQYRFLRVVCLPGLMVRKLAQSVAALACGARVTNVRIYDTEPRDIVFHADGANSVAKVLVPLAPLLACAFLFCFVSAAAGAGLTDDLTVPTLSALDGPGLREFLAGTWVLLGQALRRAFRLDWGGLKVYLLFSVAFSFASGAALSSSRMKEAVLGAAFLCVGLALAAGLVGAGGGGEAESASRASGWVASLHAAVLAGSAAAFTLMVYGVFLSLLTGIAVRIYEMAAKPSGKQGKSAPAEGRETNRRMAA